MEDDEHKEWSDEDVKKEMLNALESGQPQDEAPKDPFAVDALGQKPEEEDSMGGEND